MKRLLTFAVVLVCASATVIAQTASKPAIYAAPTDDGMLVGVATVALWSVGWSAAQAPVPATSCVILKRASADTHALQGIDDRPVEILDGAPLLPTARERQGLMPSTLHKCGRRP